MSKEAKAAAETIIAAIERALLMDLADAATESATTIIDAEFAPVVKERDDLKKLLGEYAKLREFARWVIQNGCFDGTELDGGGIQDRAIDLGLIYETRATAEDVDEFCDYSVDELIYKFTDTLAAAAKALEDK